jgi:hypothetical protein
MISIHAVYAESSERLQLGPVHCCIVGLSSDNRGDAAVDFAKSIAKRVEILNYTTQTLCYSLGDLSVPVDDLDPLVSIFRSGPVLCDTTTLGFVETLLCIRAFKEASSGQLFITYVEPNEYNNERTPGVLHRRDFSLTDRAEVFTAVPGSVIMLSSHRRCRAAVLVGYEGDRMAQFFEQTGIVGDNCSVIFGVPAFNAGWEINAFANTASELDERKISSVLFAGATSPMAAYNEIASVHKGTVAGGGLIIAPIGTKPHGIGAAFYACDNEDVGLIYDHPHKSQGRTGGVGVWNLYTPLL